MKKYECNFKSKELSCFALMLACFENYIIFFVLLFFKDMSGALSLIYLPAHKADATDYQQYNSEKKKKVDTIRVPRKNSLTE